MGLSEKEGGGGAKGRMMMMMVAVLACPSHSYHVKSGGDKDKRKMDTYITTPHPSTHTHRQTRPSPKKPALP